MNCNRKYIEQYIYMTDQDTEIVAVNDEPENEATEVQPETETPMPEPKKEEPKRVKIREVVKEPTECKDCKKNDDYKNVEIYPF